MVGRDTNSVCVCWSLGINRWWTPKIDPHWEDIEITLKELDGSLVKFQWDSQCVLMLHFRQD